MASSNAGAWWPAPLQAMLYTFLRVKDQDSRKSYPNARLPVQRPEAVRRSSPAASRAMQVAGPSSTSAGTSQALTLYNCLSSRVYMAWCVLALGLGF